MASVLEPSPAPNHSVVSRGSDPALDARNIASSTTTTGTPSGSSTPTSGEAILISSARPSKDGDGQRDRPVSRTITLQSIPMALTQSLPGQQGTPTSSASTRPRLQSLARSSPSLAYPEDQPYSATTASRSNAPKSQSAVHSLQAAVAPPTVAQSGTSPTANTGVLTPPPHSSSSAQSLTRANSLTSPTRKRSSFSHPTSPEPTGLARSKSHYPALTSSGNSSHPLAALPPPAQFTSLQEASRDAREGQDVRSPKASRLSTTRQEISVGTAGNDSLSRSRQAAAARSLGQLEAKVVILGAQGVGKTSIVHRYTSGQFNASSISSTIGASFLKKNLVVDDVKCRLQIWDTAGQERFRSMAPMYYRGSHAAIVVYDVTNYESFADVKTWIEELKRNMGEDLVIHVVGSKLDLAPYAREVDRDEAYEQVLRWLYPERELAALTAANQLSVSSSASFSSASAAAASSKPSTGSTSRLGTLSSLAMGSASRLGVAFPSSSRANTMGKQTLFGSSASSGAAATASTGSGSDGAAADTSLPPVLPGDDSDVELSEVSAKDGDGVEDVFVAITQRLVMQRATIEQARRERDRTSIFLSADDFAGRDELQAGATPDAQQWTCC